MKEDGDLRLASHSEVRCSGRPNKTPSQFKWSRFPVCRREVGNAEIAALQIGAQSDSCSAPSQGHAVVGRPDGGSTTVSGWSELQVLAMLRTAGSVVEVGSLVAAVCDWRESVIRVHDGFDEYHRLVRHAEGVLQVLAGLDDE